MCFTTTKNEFDRAKEACARFLPNNWTSVDAIEASRLSGGYANVVVLCALKPEFCDEQSKPHKVVT